MSHVIEPRVRETSLTELTADFVLAGRMRGSLAFDDVMVDGDTCDYVASYGDTLEEGIGTLNDGVLERTTIIRSRHANGTVDANKVSFAPGAKTIILHFGSKRLREFYNGGLRFDIAQSLTSDQKNQAQSNIGRLPADPGTRLLFQQTSAPVGWTKDTSHNDKAIRIVSGTVGSGGSVDFSTAFARTATDSFTITTNEMPSHAHVTNISHTHTVGLGSTGGVVDTGDPGGSDLPSVTGTQTTSGANLSGTQNVTSTSVGGGAGHQHGIDLRVKYVDFIIAQKD